MKKKEIVRDEWRVLSKKFVRHQRLPYGTRLVLEYLPSAGHPRGRKARNDMTFRRYRFQGRATDRDTVNDLFKNFLFPKLTVDLAKRGLRVRLIGPDEQPTTGNTMLRTVRAWTPLPRQSDLEAAELREKEIEEIADTADMHLRVAEEDREDSEMVLRGFLRAQVRRYGAGIVKSAVSEELSH